MKDKKFEQQVMREFSDFIEATPTRSPHSIDDAILDRVAQDLRPPVWRIFSKMTGIELMAGVATLSICPQFGMGYDHRSEVLQTLHSTMPAWAYFLVCGVLFVSVGGALSGLVLTRSEVRSLLHREYLYFAFFAVLAYVGFIVLGTEAFIISTLFWVPGAIFGNVTGFWLALRLKVLASPAQRNL